MTYTEDDYRYMARALQLAANGRGHVSPNPMVGAVVVCDGRIIGEGWHRRFGGSHAEVNAMNSISDNDRKLIPLSTMYVTLEPCSHYGKTPPCASMLVEKRIGRVVVASLDPNPKVSGRGIEILREAGIEVVTGLMEEEAIALNKAFMTAHRLKRPFVTLKWAQSADGFMDSDRDADGRPAQFSNAISLQKVHWRRANHDAIAIGAGTAIMDNPRLSVRFFDGQDSRPVIFDRHNLAGPDNCSIMVREDTIHLGSESATLDSVLYKLYSEFGITSLLVEGGSNLLSGFLSADLWDEAYVESTSVPLGEHGRVKAPVVPVTPCNVERIGNNRILTYLNRC